MNKRDQEHHVAKSRDNERMERRIDEEIQKRVKPAPEKHLRPDGMGGDSRDQQVKNIRNNIYKHMGDGAEKRREAERTLKNRQIDKKIDRALSEQSPQKEKGKARDAWKRAVTPERKPD